MSPSYMWGICWRNYVQRVQVRVIQIVPLNNLNNYLYSNTSGIKVNINNGSKTF